MIPWSLWVFDSPQFSTRLNNCWTEILHRLPIKPVLSQPQSPVTLPRAARQSNIKWKPNNTSWLVTFSLHSHSLLSSWIKFKCAFSSATSLKIPLLLLSIFIKFHKSRTSYGQFMSSWYIDRSTRFDHICMLLNNVSTESWTPRGLSVHHVEFPYFELTVHEFMHACVFNIHAKPSLADQNLTGRRQSIPQGCHCCKSSASRTCDKKLLLSHVNPKNQFDILGRSQIKLYDEVVLKYLRCCHLFVFWRNEYLQKTHRKEWGTLNCFHLINFFGKNLLSAFT